MVFPKSSLIAIFASVDDKYRPIESLVGGTVIMMHLQGVGVFMIQRYSAK